VSSELKEFNDIEQVQSKIALIFDYESCWAWEILPQGKDFVILSWSTTITERSDR